MRAQGADSGASSNSTTAVIEDKVATLSLSEDGRARERKSGADKVNLTDEEAAALQELLDVGGDERDGGQSADEPGATDGADGQAGDGKSREPGQRQPRLERQVFVGGLPVDVTSTLFRTWADQVFHGRVINAVLVRWPNLAHLSVRCALPQASYANTICATTVLLTNLRRPPCRNNRSSIV